jgi:hypothetical protein
VQILVIAVLMKGVMGRTFNVFQWEALLLLVAGITVNQLNYCSPDSGGDTFSTPALLYTLGAPREAWRHSLDAAALSCPQPAHR